MALYMTQFSYTTEAVAHLAGHPHERSAAVGKHLDQIGGKLIGFYYSIGDYDGVVIYEAPEPGAAFALLAAVSSSGFLKASKTTLLLSEEDGAMALKKAGGLIIQAP